jgi:ketosteroid isomerase-like protein
MDNVRSKHFPRWRPRDYFLGLLFITVVSCQTDEKKVSEKDTQSIQAAVDQYINSALEGNWEAWGNTLAPDVIVCPPNEEPLNGREAAVAWARKFPKISSLKVTNAEIAITSDFAYGFGLYDLVVEMPGGLTMQQQGSHMDIFRKQPDGKWLYSRAIWHANTPMTNP